MFEVGKKYINKTTNRVSECVSVFGMFGWMVGADGTPVTYPYRSKSTQWEEYIEPRKEFFNAYKTAGGNTYYAGPFFNRGLADSADMIIPNRRIPRYGVLIVTHHSDTKIETHFEVTRK